ncbi:hypothetical protein QEN19_003485 [Hanseniaspora menglaensis]
MARNTGSGGFKSFSDLLRENGGNGDEEDRNTFAGGETSGLEIQDPKKERERLLREMNERNSDESSVEGNKTKALLQQLMDKAQRNGTAPADDSDEESLQEETFGGAGQRLGSNLDPSAGILSSSPEMIQPQSIVKSRPSKVSREITFWADGFTLGHDSSGKLYRYDDAANAHYLKELDQGRAPLSLLDVELGQRVDVTVKKNTDQKYVQPKRVGGFEGHGARLGSEIPTEISDMTEINTNEIVVKPISEDELARKQPVEKGETKIQIRYANGTKEVYKTSLNTTIEELYAYVKKGGKFNVFVEKPFTINHVFPLKPITEMENTLKDEGLENAAVVQRWVL